MSRRESRTTLGWNRRRYLTHMIAPLAVIHLYRAIPPPVRGLASSRKTVKSTSHLCLDAVRAGGGWLAFRQAMETWD